MNELEGWMDEAWETLESDGKLWMGDGGRKNITVLTATTAATTESLTTNTSTNAQERLERIVDAVKALKVNCDELFYKKSKINHRFFRVFTFQACHDWLKNWLWINIYINHNTTFPPKRHITSTSLFYYSETTLPALSLTSTPPTNFFATLTTLNPTNTTFPLFNISSTSSTHHSAAHKYHPPIIQHLINPIFPPLNRAQRK